MPTQINNRELIQLLDTYFQRRGVGGGAPSPHDILGAHHSIAGGAALDLVGQSGAATIARVTPSADPGAAAAVLKTTGAGLLSLEQLDVDQWIDMADDAWIGQDPVGDPQWIKFRANGDILVKLPDNLGARAFEIQASDATVLLDVVTDGWVGIPGALNVSGDCDLMGDTYLDGFITHVGTNIGFFNTVPAIKTVVADQAAWVNVVAGADHVDLADLNTKMQAIRDKLQALLDALQSYGLA